MRRAGFTLIELLVVIAIIAIIAAMLFPLMLEAKESARKRVCCSNIRQLGFAVTNYFEDYDGYGLPAPMLSEGYYHPWVLCPKTIEKYVGQKAWQMRYFLPGTQPARAWICPGDLNRGTADEFRPFWYVMGSSYMYPGSTAYMSGEFLTDVLNVVPRRPMTWRNPRRDILLSDYGFDFHSGRTGPHDLGEGGITAPSWVSTTRIKNMTVLFLDLHVEMVTSKQRDKLVEIVKTTDNPYWVKP